MIVFALKANKDLYVSSGLIAGKLIYKIVKVNVHQVSQFFTDHQLNALHNLTETKRRRTCIETNIIAHVMQRDSCVLLMNVLKLKQYHEGITLYCSSVSWFHIHLDRSTE